MRELLALQLAHLSSDGKVEPELSHDARTADRKRDERGEPWPRRAQAPTYRRQKNGHEGGEPKEENAELRQEAEPHDHAEVEPVHRARIA
jgi:hypothetical protein